jgi:dTDP-D-glucose 4,6-dehydratase
VVLESASGHNEFVRAIHDAGDFIKTDVYGTFVLLEAFRQAKRPRRFVQISTDEVYGAIPSGSAKETDPIAPRNPYAASKAGADRLAYSYHVTHGVPVMVTRSSNNYGPRQHPEKIIPLFVTNALEDRRLPLYGDGASRCATGSTWRTTAARSTSSSSGAPTARPPTSGASASSRTPS